MKVIETAEATAIIADYFDLICDTDYAFDESEILRRMNANAVDEEPRKHSHWVPMFNGEYTGGAYWFECAECGKVVAGGLQSDNLFCPKCGSDMSG